MQLSSKQEVIRLVSDLRDHKPDAASSLAPLVYDELRRLARRYMRQERPDHTLQATALVHEAYLRLVEPKEMSWQGRAHFFAVAAQSIRRILIDHARGHQTAKRGGTVQKVALEDELLLFSPHKAGELVALDEALERLAAVSLRQSRIVELRFFGGLTVEETAEVLEISPKTVKRDWSVARAWLYREIDRANNGSETMAGLGTV